MNTKIDGYKSLLALITVAQNVQFHRDATGQIESLVTQTSGIFPAFEAYRSDSVTLDAEFDRKRRSAETDELAFKDDIRDAITVQLISRIDFHARLPQNNVEKDAARVLQFIADGYRDAPHKSYQAETSYIRNMVAELRKNGAALNLFGLTPLIDRLDRENTEFETLYNIRTNAREAKRERGTLTQLVKKTNESFNVLCQIINGLSLMPLENVTKSELEQIASSLNAQIHQYEVNYRRHAGSGKKKEEEKEGE
ncbi:MAG: DUF6261 family protein [Prevotellaceae bacterium]|jgi:hypothetical protein|nr:DUF6261 family protein [Prevotellaceae bacterium]